MLPRLYRQAPLNSIWEGSGNIQCLDVLRALQKEPAVRDALFDELSEARGHTPGLRREPALAEGRFRNTADNKADDKADDTADGAAALESRSRLLVERTALALQAAMLLEAGNEEVANAFCAARLGDARGVNYGTLPAGTPMASLIERALPVL